MCNKRKKVIIIICSIIILIYILKNEYDSRSFINGNKSYIRNDYYTKDNSTGNNIFSLTFDDTIDLFEDISINKYDSIFDNSTLKYFKKIHDNYGVCISCYVFYENENFNLSKFPSKYKEQFIENSNWLRFGFHARSSYDDFKNDNITNDYVLTINELERIVGKESIDNIIRLHMFKGSYKQIELLSKLNSEPIKGLYTSDDNRTNYYLNNKENKYIYSHDMYVDKDLEIYYLSSDLRIEYIENIENKINELNNECWNNQKGDLVVFSHEWAINNKNKHKINEICKYAYEKKYRFTFFEDILY